MNNGRSKVVTCAGAVIGAGFASGREVVAFFTRYGVHAWWLIMLSALTMTGLCVLCMHAACENGLDWTNSVPGGRLAQICPLMLMQITAGAMVSAAGHMVALLWSHPQAYMLGALGTLLMAWRMGHGESRR